MSLTFATLNYYPYGRCCDWKSGDRYNDSKFKPYDVIVLDSGSARSESEFMTDRAVDELSFSIFIEYNRYLRVNSYLKGTIVIKFTVKHDGSVINDTILSSTTGNKKFDKRIREKIKNINICKWKEIGKGTTTVTVPITFWTTEESLYYDKFIMEQREKKKNDSLKETL
jgi:TonB family protein